MSVSVVDDFLDQILQFLDLLHFSVMLIQQRQVVVTVGHVAKPAPKEVGVGYTSVYQLVETVESLEVSYRASRGVEQLVAQVTGTVESLVKELLVVRQLLRASRSDGTCRMKLVE